MAEPPNMPKDGELYSVALKALINLGGSGTNEQILEQIKLILNLQDNEKEQHVKKRFGWIKTHLKNSGLIKQLSYSKWSLTSDFPNPNPDIYTIDQFLLDTSITSEELDRYEKNN